MYNELFLKTILENIIDESPIGTYKTIGDFKKAKSFNDPRDISSITNPTTVKKVENLFKNTIVDFDLYFVNKPGLRRFSEKGIAKYEFLVRPYPHGLGLSPDEFKINNDNITVFFVSNIAAQKIPMTPWTIAHRIGHAMRLTYAFEEYTNWLDKQFDELLAIYGIRKPNEYQRYEYGKENFYYKNLRKFDLAKGRLFNSIGTMRSARENKIYIRYFEFYYELFVQYIKDGAIKFNPLSQKILVGFGPYGSKTIAYTKNLEEAQEKLNSIQNDIPYYLNDVLNANVGNIFVM